MCHTGAFSIICTAGCYATLYIIDCNRERKRERERKKGGGVCVSKSLNLELLLYNEIIRLCLVYCLLSVCEKKLLDCVSFFVDVCLHVFIHVCAGMPCVCVYVCVCVCVCMCVCVCVCVGMHLCIHMHGMRKGDQ